MHLQAKKEKEKRKRKKKERKKKHLYREPFSVVLEHKLVQKAYNFSNNMPSDYNNDSLTELIGCCLLKSFLTNKNPINSVNWSENTKRNDFDTIGVTMWRQAEPDAFIHNVITACWWIRCIRPSLENSRPNWQFNIDGIIVAIITKDIPNNHDSKTSSHEVTERWMQVFYTLPTLCLKKQSPN